MEQKESRHRRLEYYKQILQKSPVCSKAAEAYEQKQDGSMSVEQLYIHVLAPVLTSFVKWVLEEAVKSGKKRLYFLARDGYQMYLVAERLCEEWQLDIECRYLHVSRYAVRLPEYHLLKEQCLERICVGGIDVTFWKIMKRAALTDKECYQIAVECGYENHYNEQLSYPEVMKLKEVLKNSAYFLEFVYAHSKEVFEDVAGYLKQEGLLDEIPYALVDSGWIGTLQQSIQHLLDAIYQRENHREFTNRIEGYYFGLYELPHKGLAHNYHAFYFSPSGAIRRKVHFSNCLFEAVFSAPAGMTIGYEKKENGRYEPILDQKEHPNQQQILEHVNILKVYLEKYFEVAECENHTPLSVHREEDTQLIENLLSKFMGEPTSFELEAYGSILFSDDVLEKDLRNVSAELSEEEIKNQNFWNKALIMLGLKKGKIQESAWIEGSIVKNGTRVKHHLRQAACYKYFVYLRKWIKNFIQ